MTLKDFILDNNYRSRKFILSVISIVLITSLGILWAANAWAHPVLLVIVDGITTIVLAYCGITAARAAIPMASDLVAKTRTGIGNKPLPKPDAKEDLAGSKEDL